MRTITTNLPTLFHVAAAELGDATQWLRLARLNRTDEPMLGGMTTLLVPERDPKAGGGIAEQ